MQTAEGFPLGGSWHGGAVTDEGTGLGQLSSRRHLIRLTTFGTSPQGDALACLYMKIFLLPDFYMVFRKEQ